MGTFCLEKTTMRMALNLSACLNVVLAVGFVACVLSTSDRTLGSAVSRVRNTHMVIPVTPSMRVKTGIRRAPISPKSTAKLDFLEAKPYYDKSTIPVNTHKNKAPLTAKVLSVERIVGPKATGETCNIVIDHEGKMPYWEGQSAGVIPPGIDPKRNKPYGVRLYSIASTRYGDDFTGKTMTLCVRRATYWDPELGKEDPAKKGVCSNYLCDAKPGTELALTGPAGKVMLMPEEKPETPIIMLATGTGIAPYRGFLRRLFVENTEAAEKFKGLAWLFLAMKTGRQCRRNTLKSSATTLRFPVSKRTRAAVRCTSRIRLRNTERKSSSS